jgi:hypothetical protein
MVKVFIPTGDNIKVCPFLFKECKIPVQEDCPIRQAAHNSVDIVGWREATDQAMACQFTGDTLTEKEYLNRCRGKMSSF